MLQRLRRGKRLVSHARECQAGSGAYVDGSAPGVVKRREGVIGFVVAEQLLLEASVEFRCDGRRKRQGKSVCPVRRPADPLLDLLLVLPFGPHLEFLSQVQLLLLLDIL